jgi:hypothetical protein
MKSTSNKDSKLYLAKPGLWGNFEPEKNEIHEKASEPIFVPIKFDCMFVSKRLLGGNA